MATQTIGEVDFSVPLDFVIDTGSSQSGAEFLLDVPVNIVMSAGPHSATSFTLQLDVAIAMEALGSGGAIQIPDGPQSGDEDRFRFIVEEAVTGNLLTLDLNVTKPKITRVLSGPASIEFDVSYLDMSASNIPFSPWGYIIHVEKEVYGERIIWASGIVQPSQVDEQTGNLHLQAKGFSTYPKGLPWLVNWNPLAVDPFEVVQYVWSSLQQYSNGDLGVNVYPASSGLEMLPGYAFDGNIANFNFFAYYVRASDLTDCGDVITSLAQDIPFDFIEQSAWNDDYSAIEKQIFLGYPMAGVQQDGLAFILNENVIEAKPYVETTIDWASDVIINGWYPGTVYSSTFTNSPANRFRRVISENQAQINSVEIAAAWALRKLTKRQTPPYWSDISVIMGHPNAPFGTYDVGDRIWVNGYMPWVGNIDGNYYVSGNVNTLHKILAIQVNEEQGTCELALMAAGAFNYNPVYYQGADNGFATMEEANLPQATITTPDATIGIG